ncbi:alpha/beta fold hydrolase [Paractinoplanes hotanensis]|uniref:Alpha/beta hydrolase n=1 Tax=Paractinoplanes hotanensis TaxID=2906497 RepID=A0ABT0Y8C9_9ACTN|nr:alpha/beta hydrolase [Actinoplanes hotanensis]MCM4082311.1 alpha/beta hydrolase [Actinoplanes hotanensis]
MRVRARGLTFDVAVAGPADGVPVLLLHGFPQDHREFDQLLPRLHAAGLRTYAPDQRGYSPGARPVDTARYVLTEPQADAVALLDELGLGSVHVVGHDWGAQVAWRLAAEQPDRVRTLTAISLPHPRALTTALKNDVGQRIRLGYVPLLRTTRAGDLLLAGDGRAIRLMMRRLGPAADQYVTALREPGRLSGALAWYRALTAGRVPRIGSVAVPTTYIWGTKDPAVGRRAALGTRDWVHGPYRFLPLPGVGHWAPEEAPDDVATAVLDRIGAPTQH